MSVAGGLVDRSVDRGWWPDPLLRWAIRGLLRRRLRHERRGGPADRAARQAALRRRLSTGPVTVHADLANEQHYEVPPAFFELVLGPRLKYSAAWWPAGVDALATAEDATLELTVGRAQLEDGQDILDLGCGWGSFSLWAAERYPRARITAVSNSRAQRAVIEDRAARSGLRNLTVLTSDVADLELEPASFDRVVSVEMVEHVRNHAELLRRVAGWLRPDGRLFVHHFAHRDTTYLFGEETGRGGADWMARHFFTGGVMPSDTHLLHLTGDLVPDGHWVIDGTHYARTARAWLDRLDTHRETLEGVLGGGREGAARVARWRTFFLACEELFASSGGKEWWVTHRRFAPRTS